MSTQAINMAAVAPSVGAPFVVQERAIPSPKSGEVLIKNRAVAINPVDHKRQTTGLVTKFPAVLGLDLAGTIVSVGEDVTHLSPGDRVLGFSSTVTHGCDYSAFQDYTLVLAHLVAKLPAHTTFEQAAMLPSAVATATMYLFNVLGLPQIPPPADEKEKGEDNEEENSKQQPLLIWGAASSVGTLVLQLASRVRNPRRLRILAVASARHHAKLRDLGADLVFDYASPGVVDDIVTAATATGKGEEGGRPDGENVLSMAVDCISMPETLGPVCEVLERCCSSSESPSSSGQYDEKKEMKKATLAHLLPLAAAVGFEVPAGTPVEFKYTATGGNFGGEAELARWMFGEYLPAALETGHVVPTPELRVVGHGLGSVEAAMRLLEKGVSSQKIVVSL